MKYSSPSAVLKRIREEQSLSQRELAYRAGTAQSVVARIELGKTDPTWKTFTRLVGAAGYELTPKTRRKAILDRSELDDIPRILALTPEERLLEVARVSQFVAASRRV